MKLYMHPVSMTSRPVRLFIAENKIPVEEVTVDLFTGEHVKPPYSDLNPSCMVPMLEDGDLRMTESSAILKYLADKIGSPAYPKDLKQRAKVNEVMDWINTQFYRDWAYNMIYPQIFPTNKRRSDEAQAATVELGQNNAETMAEGAQRSLYRPEQPVSDRQSDHHRRLFRRCVGDPRRDRAGRLLRSIPTSSAGSTT